MSRENRSYDNHWKSVKKKNEMIETERKTCEHFDLERQEDETKRAL